VVEFTEALAELLRDGRRREQFAENPSLAQEDMALESGDRAALLHIRSDELEMQSTVLHRKRFAEIQCVLAATCAKLGDSAWPLFQKYARYCWPDGETDGRVMRKLSAPIS